MPRRTHKPGSKQQRKRSVPKVRRYSLPRIRKMLAPDPKLLNACLMEPTADRVKYYRTMVTVALGVEP